MPRLRILRRGNPAVTVTLPRDLFAMLMDALPAELTDAPPPPVDAETYRFDPARDRPLHPPVSINAAGQACW